MIFCTNLALSGNLSEDDKCAVELFKLHEHEFALDKGDLFSRYLEAKAFTDMYFRGTQYCVKVEEYCIGCTETALCRR